MPYILRVRTTRATYRRRRILALLVMTAFILALYAVGGASAGSPPSYYTVAPGDTVWSIAVDHYPPQEDPRPRVVDIRDANDLTGYRVHPGQRLELPPAD